MTLFEKFKELFWLAIGIFVLPVEKLIAMVMLMMYCCSRVGGK